MFAQRLNPDGPLVQRFAFTGVLNVANTTNRQTLEASGAAFAAALNDQAITPQVSAQPTAGFMLSHLRCQGGNVSLALSNLTGAPADPAGLTVTAGLQYQDARLGPSGKPLVDFSQVSVDFGAIANATVLEANIIAAGVPNFAWVSPAAALPAGLAFSHWRVAGGALIAGLANLTGAPIDPAAITFNCLVERLTATAGTQRAGSSGPLAWKNYRGVSIDHGAIPANDTLAGTLAIAGLRSTDLVFASPRAALPDVALAYSHSFATNGQANVVLANLSGAPIDPAAIVWDLLVARGRM